MGNSPNYDCVEWAWACMSSSLGKSLGFIDTYYIIISRLRQDACVLLMTASNAPCDYTSSWCNDVCTREGRSNQIYMITDNSYKTSFYGMLLRPHNIIFHFNRGVYKAKDVRRVVLSPSKSSLKVLKWYFYSFWISVMCLQIWFFYPWVSVKI
mgnify:CR=1 FL=1